MGEISVLLSTFPTTGAGIPWLLHACFVRFSVSLLALARGLGLTSELAPSLLALVMWVRPRKEWDAGSGRAVWVHELAVVKPSPTPWITSSSL